MLDIEETINQKAELEALRSEIKVLEEDNSRWKGRTEQILAKYEVLMI
jgi:cell shape-determining protein MreC